MTSPAQLLDQARLLCNRPGRARDADLKRATSAIYYALFHAVACRFADALVGARHRRSSAWIRVYRALDHGRARQEFKRISSVEQSGALFLLSTDFVELQGLRHSADYDPRPFQMTRVGVEQLVKRATAVIAAFSHIADEQWREIATSILLGGRR